MWNSLELDLCKLNHVLLHCIWNSIFLIDWIIESCLLSSSDICLWTFFIIINDNSTCNSFQLYYSDEISMKPVSAIEGKCEVRKKQDIPIANCPVIFDHIFFCEHLYDPEKGAIKKVIIFLLVGVKLNKNN